MSVFRQHCSRGRGPCPQVVFLQETKSRECIGTLGCLHWMVFAHWLTKWTCGIKCPLAAVHLNMNCASHIGLLFHAAVSLHLDSLNLVWKANLRYYTCIDQDRNRPLFEWTTSVLWQNFYKFPWQTAKILITLP